MSKLWSDYPEYDEEEDDDGEGGFVPQTSSLLRGLGMPKTGGLGMPTEPRTGGLGSLGSLGENKIGGMSTEPRTGGLGSLGGLGEHKIGGMPTEPRTGGLGSLGGLGEHKIGSLGGLGGINRTSEPANVLGGRPGGLGGRLGRGYSSLDGFGKAGEPSGKLGGGLGALGKTGESSNKLGKSLGGLSGIGKAGESSKLSNKVGGGLGGIGGFSKAGEGAGGLGSLGGLSGFGKTNESSALGSHSTADNNPFKSNPKTKQQTMPAAIAQTQAQTQAQARTLHVDITPQLVKALNDISTSMEKLNIQADASAARQNEVTKGFMNHIERFSGQVVKSFKEVHADLSNIKNPAQAEVEEAQRTMEQIVDVIDNKLASSENMIYMVVPGAEINKIIHIDVLSEEVVKANRSTVRIVGSVKALAQDPEPEPVPAHEQQVAIPELVPALEPPEELEDDEHEDEDD